MHGREQREGENQRRIIEHKSSCGGQHMRSVSLSNTKNSLDDGEATPVSNFIATVSVDSFCKDGRKISVGDCALFEPPQDSPPFIGIIRCLKSCEENNLQLGVNWLYRPVELELGKGILLDATPNEIFYSFHEDEIPAASLLHPCKVAFLPKGIEFPPGTSSFVCRRVYDVKNKRLWWLTDQDYINERQQEVDRLLQSTRLEMDSSFQPGNRSPRLTNNSMPTLQFKQGSDNAQGSVVSIPSQTKGKKRERGDPSFDIVKRERSLRSDDTDSSTCKPENSLRSEIAKMKEKGGLADFESVEKLVQLMQLDKVDKRIDLASCSTLAGVIAATDKVDCLNRFIQLKGLPVFDEWLQDVHKGKIGDVASLKDGEKSVEDFLLVLLRALDKLPVNLHALQTCLIGKSVNNLRSHKNLEIQKKARSLVDTWKKRVEAEMNATDAKSASPQAASWSTKSRLSETHGGKNSGGSGDIALKSPATQLSASKTISVKVSQVEPAGKSTSSSPGALKSASSPASIKEGNPRITAGSASDVPLSTREDKSSSSSQSHNYSQSFSVKDDARSSPVGSLSTSKISSGSRHRKSINGFPGTLASGSQKEAASCRNSSTHRNTTHEKFLQSVSTVDKSLEVPPVEGNTNKLIVKIPNRGRSPAQSVSGGSLEEPSIMDSRASSPVLSDKHEGSDRNSKDKGDACRTVLLSEANAESWQSNDFKDLQAGSDEGDGSPAPLVDEERSRPTEDIRKVPEVPKAASSSSGNLKSSKLRDASFSSMNALIESCVKYSEANTSMSGADDVGMNLLASVAAGEICKSDLLTPNDSPQGVEEISPGEDVNLNSREGITRDHCQPNLIDGGDVKHSKPPNGSLSKDGTGMSKLSAHSSGDRKATSDFSEETLQATSDCVTEMNAKLDGILISKSFLLSTNMGKDRDGDPIKQPGDHKDVDPNTLSGTELEHKVDVLVPTSSMTSEKKDVNGRLNTGVLELQPAVADKGEVCPDAGYVKNPVQENVDKLKVREADENHGNCANHSEGARVDQKILVSPNHSEGARVDPRILVSPKDENASGLGSEGVDQVSESLKANTEKKEVAEPHSLGSFVEKEEASQDVVGIMDLREPKNSDAGADGKVVKGSTVSGSYLLAAAGEPEVDSKINFDLNEGLIGDDGKYVESVNPVTSGCLSTVQVVNPLSTAATVSSSIPASITVTAAAKGPFVPPVDLLRSKGELGWKGSAATSAFRPAEPRKVLQLPLGSLNVSTPDDSTSKPGRAALDFDLNVPDERVLEDLGCQDSNAEIGLAPVHLSINNHSRSELTGSVSGRSFGGLDLDLNRVDDTNDILQCSTSSIHRLEAPIPPLKSASSSSFPNIEVRRDFDLNNGPSFEDTAGEQSSFIHHGRGSTHSIHTQPALPGLRSSNLEAGNFSTWFSPGTSYPSITIPSSLPDRGEHPFPIIPPGAPQRILGPSGGNPFTPDVFRSSVLASSPALPFTPSQFTYQMIPFGPSLPMPSATFSVGSTSFMDSTTGGRIFTPPVNSQFLGSVSAVSSQYPSPFMVSLPESSNNGGVENNRKWSRQGLDLNSGPGVLDIEGREETLAQRQLAVGSSQALAEEQARLFPLPGVLKRKEPDGGWDSENLRYKQSTWQ